MRNWRQIPAKELQVIVNSHDQLRAELADMSRIAREAQRLESDNEGLRAERLHMVGAMFEKDHLAVALKDTLAKLRAELAAARHSLVRIADMDCNHCTGSVEAASLLESTGK